MNTQLTKGLTKDQKVEFTEIYNSAISYRRKMQEIMENLIQEKLSAILSQSNLNDINFQQSQTDRIAYARALRDIKSLIS